MWFNWILIQEKGKIRHALYKDQETLNKSLWKKFSCSLSVLISMANDYSTLKHSRWDAKAFATYTWWTKLWRSLLCTNTPRGKLDSSRCITAWSTAGLNYNCVLYTNNVEETVFHLFFSCPFISKECWQYLGIQWNNGNELFQMLLYAKQHFQALFSWKSSSSQPGKFGSEEMTSSLIEGVPPLVPGRGCSLRNLNCKLWDSVTLNGRLSLFV